MTSNLILEIFLGHPPVEITEIQDSQQSASAMETNNEPTQINGTEWVIMNVN